MIKVSSLPVKVQNSISKFTPAVRDKWLAERERAMTDQLYLATEVLEMDFQETPHRWLFDKMLKKELGVPFYDLDLVKKKRMILWSRGTFKTSSIIVEIVSNILFYPDIRIAFLSGTHDLAKRQLARVKRVFETPTKKFADLFPEFCGEKLGNATSFNVPCQTAARAFAEPTMAVTTAKSTKAGSHYDVIFVDDLVNDSNYTTSKALQKSIQDYRDVCPLLAPSGYMYITGTRYSFGDLYEEVQVMAKREKEELGTDPWVISIKSCWTKVCKTCGHNDAEHDFDSDLSGPCAMGCGCRQFVDSGAQVVLFPQFRTKDGRTEGHTVAFLQSEKVRSGAEFFACQYENNPIAQGEQTFTDDLIGGQTVWHENQFPTEQQAQCFVMGDLSYVGDDKRDVTVFYVVRRWQGRLYVVDCVSGKWNAHEVAENMFMLMLKHRPLIIYLEKIPAFGSYQMNFDMFAQNKGITKLPIEWRPMSNQKDAKKIRIGSIQSVLAQKRLFLYGHMPMYEELSIQLKRWPKLGRHDDFADCLGLVCEAPTGIEFDSIPKNDLSALSFIKRLHQFEDSENFYDSRIPGTY